MNDTMDHAGHSGHMMMNIHCDGSLGKAKRGTWKGRGRLQQSIGLDFKKQLESGNASCIAVQGHFSG